MASSRDACLVKVPAYLARLGDRGPLAPTLDTLRRLHLAHLSTVPFENLDIVIGRPIVLDEGSFYRKIVEAGRGGFCYELNGLFACLLRELGFAVSLVSARVVTDRGTLGPEFDHIVLKVDLSRGSWLADVAYSLRYPLPFSPAAQADPLSEPYRIVESDHGFRVEYEDEAGSPEPQYHFDLQPRRLEEFAEMCRLHQSRPESRFAQRRICTLATPYGRLIYSDGRVVEERDGRRVSDKALHPGEVRAFMHDRFGLFLSESDLASWDPRGKV